MNHPTKEQVEKAVKLWRCRDAYKQTCHFSDTCVFAKHEDGFKVGQYANCQVAEIVGFRLPPRCEDCGNRAEGIRRGAGEHSLCHDCWDVEGRPNYTPRQLGKGGAA